jgi:iron(III) transport system permease protein
MMDLRAASELAGMLAFLALFIVLLEHGLRRRSRYYQPGGKTPGIARARLSGWRGWVATVVCLLVVAVAFILPISQLSYWGWQEMGRMQADVVPVYARLALNSLLLAGLAAAFTTVIGLFLSSHTRVNSSKAVRVMARLATTGYAIPGAVIAVGILIPLSALDHALNDFWVAWRGVTVGLIFTGSLVGLTYAYVTRFLAVSYSSVDASMEKITVNITQVARILRAGNWRIMWQIHLPLVVPGMLAGAILVFVDVMKELPITVMLRPFGYDTLAVWVWQMAAESLWAGASLPALAIVLVGLLPVIVLMYADTRKKAADDKRG